MIACVVCSFVFCALCVGMNIYCHEVWRREREDYLNRLMAKDIGEYERLSEKEEPLHDMESYHERAIKKFRQKGKNSI